MRSLLILCFIFPTCLMAQKVVQLEKRGNPETQKFKIGDELIYTLKDDETWYTATINDILPEENIILFENRLVKVADITALKFYNNRNWSKNIGNSLFTFSGGWVLFGLIDRAEIADRVGLNQQDPGRAPWDLILIPAGVAIVTGILIKQIFKQHVKKMGKKHRLRLLDLTPVSSLP